MQAQVGLLLFKITATTYNAKLLAGADRTAMDNGSFPDAAGDSYGIRSRGGLWSGYSIETAITPMLELNLRYLPGEGIVSLLPATLRRVRP